MENYTKYKLKAEDELAALLEGKDNLFVIGRAILHGRPVDKGALMYDRQS